jgi:6,7-dimethyl-8-ribityllumazine synthase
VKTIEGSLNGEGLKVCLVASRFNDLITSKLIAGARDTLVRHKVRDEDITLVKVPGAWEIPLAAQKVLSSAGGHHAVICLSAVIRGETPHFNYVASEISKGIALVGLQYRIPVIYGVITADTFDQALDRAGGKQGNKGSEAAMAALEMASLMPQI